jgi:hypothetical protein
MLRRLGDIRDGHAGREHEEGRVGVAEVEGGVVEYLRSGVMLHMYAWMQCIISDDLTDQSSCTEMYVLLMDSK